MNMVELFLVSSYDLDSFHTLRTEIYIKLLFSLIVINKILLIGSRTSFV